MQKLIPALSILFALTLSSCTTLEKPGSEDQARFVETAFAKLPGWGADHPAQAIPALQKSCKVIMTKDAADPFGTTGTYGDWQAVCQKLSLLLLPTDDEARAFFEENFQPYEIWGKDGRDGLFTGYYEPTLRGAYKKKKPYLIPLYSRPDNLITVNLGDFKQALKGETIMGRVSKQNLVPYYTRKEIEKGALKKQKKIIWVDNAVDAFFLHIQGSGQVKLKNGKTVRVGYAAQNGQVYTAIGKELLNRGALEKGNVSMQTIRAWLEAHPDEAADVMNINNSYIFFQKVDGDGPLGAQGVPLTPGRSIAVDRKKLPYGAPLWLDAEAPGGDGRIERLMIAQDTGGAITGAVRGDYFWGDSAEAAEKAGIMKSKGQLYILLPRTAPVKTQPWWEKFFNLPAARPAARPTLNP